MIIGCKLATNAYGDETFFPKSTCLCFLCFRVEKIMLWPLSFFPMVRLALAPTFISKLSMKLNSVVLLLC